MTSVGPGSSIQRTCSSSIASSPTAVIASSADGLTFIASSAYRATDTICASSTVIPDSLTTSMLTPPLPCPCSPIRM